MVISLNEDRRTEVHRHRKGLIVLQGNHFGQLIEARVEVEITRLDGDRAFGRVQSLFLNGLQN